MTRSLKAEILHAETFVPLGDTLNSQFVTLKNFKMYSVGTLHLTRKS